MDIPLSNRLDKNHFELLFKKEISRLHNFARQYVHDYDAAMDICQNVFILLWDKRETLDASANLKSYLYTSVKNRCLNYLRDQKKYRSRILDLECADEDTFFVEQETAETDDVEMQIQNAIASLPEKCREVFEMSRFRELKYKEIAEELNISQKTVEAHMSKAMRTLRDILGHLRVLMLMLWYLMH